MAYGKSIGEYASALLFVSVCYKNKALERKKKSLGLKGGPREGVLLIIENIGRLLRKHDILVDGGSLRTFYRNVKTHPKPAFDELLAECRTHPELGALEKEIKRHCKRFLDRPESLEMTEMV